MILEPMFAYGLFAMPASLIEEHSCFYKGWMEVFEDDSNDVDRYVCEENLNEDPEQYDDCQNNVDWDLPG